jgi:hypothetical protein
MTTQKREISKKRIIVGIGSSVVLVALLIGFASGYSIALKKNGTISSPENALSTSPLSIVPQEKRFISPTDPETYFVNVSDHEISIRHDVFREEENGRVQVSDGRKGNLYPKEIGNILYKEKTDEIYSPIWSSDGKKIAYVLTRYQRSPAKLFSNIYIVNADGTNNRKVTSIAQDDNAEATLAGYYPTNNRLAFFWVSGYPAPISGSFSVLDLEKGTITKIPEIPIQDIPFAFDNHQALKSSPDGNTFLIATNTHLYSYNVAAHKLTTLFTIPLEDLHAAHPKGDSEFSGDFIPIVQIDPDSNSKSMYFTNNEINISYKTSRQMYYYATTNTIQKSQ